MTDKAFIGQNYVNNLQMYMQDIQASTSQQYHQLGAYSVSNNSTGSSLSQISTMYDVTYAAQLQNKNASVVNQNLFPNGSACFDQIEGTNWPESRQIMEIERGLKFTDKMETIEISSKDLSPASCCSNIDLLLPDFYKSLSKDVSYFSKLADPQWYCSSNYNNQKYNEYPSCAQVSKDAQANDKTVKYCSIQKNDIDNQNRGCIYNTNITGDYVFHSKSFMSEKHYIEEPPIDLFTYDVKHAENSSTQQHMFQGVDSVHYNSIQNLEQCADASNEESDIVVEESEEDVTDYDYNEDHEKKNNYITNCAVCNVPYTPLESQFYSLTMERPLTMSSQIPVFAKLTDLLGVLNYKCNFLCSQCLGLINTIDHLHLKLESCKREICEKYEKTCKENSILLPNSYLIKRSPSDKTKLLRNYCFKCKVCKKSYTLRNFYYCHMKKHKMKNRLLCESCGQRFTNIQKFKYHLKRHNKNICKRKVRFSTFACNLCERQFRTRSNLKEHRNYCSGNLPYYCSHTNCDKRFPSATKLKNHVKLKHDKKFSAICSICNIGFVKASDYKYHMVTHSTEKKFNCSKCDKSYKTLSNLNFHMKYHNKKLPFICEICQKGFMRKEYLEAHVNVHNGIKTFVCQVCDKRFVSQKNLDAHMKYHDGNVKKKGCNICGKMLTTGFEEHLRTHLNLKEFECDICDLRFNTKGALSKHNKNKHA